ncbi:tetratricopeptide repeat protein [Stenotrophomonas rhizophila]
MPSLRHRLTGCLLLALSATPALAGPDSPAAPTGTLREDAAAAAIVDSITLAERGDSVGALLGFERAFADPDTALLSEPLRLDGLITAGRTAFNARQAAQARTYLDAALQQAPDDPRALYVLGRLLLWQEDMLEGTRLITRALRASDAMLGDVDIQMAHALVDALQDQPDARRELLQVLFDRDWKDEGIEPTSLWLQLAVLQADAGQRERLAATVARIDTPMEVVALRTDKRFDAVVDRRDPRFDPLQSARRYTDALRVEGLLRPERSDRVADFTATLLLIGEHEQVLSTSETLYTRLSAPNAPRSFVGADYAAWVLSHRATAEHRLGRDDAAEATLLLAASLGEAEAPGNRLLQLYLASWYLAREQPERALEAIAGLDPAPMFGEYMRQWIRFSAYRTLGDADRSAQARAWLQANQGEGRAAYVDVLLTEDRIDDAARQLIADLQTTAHRQDALLLMQDFRMLAPMAGDVANDRRWQQLLRRADVLAAARAVGRIETQPIYSRSAWR